MRRVLLAHHWMAIACCHVAITLLPACTTADKPQQAQEMESSQNRQQIQLDRSVRFATPDGKDVVVEPGAYKVEQATGSQIRLVPAGDAQPILLSAEAVPLNPNVSVPTAIPMPLEPDEYDLILQLPNGQTLTAHGSVNQVQARALPKGPMEAIAPAGAVVTKGPDLVGCVSCKNTWGGCVYIASITNRGDIAVPQSIAEISLPLPFEYYNYDRTKKWPHIWIVPALGAGETKEYFVPVQFRDIPAPLFREPYTLSEYIPRLRVDLRNQVSESNENNNLSFENPQTGVTCPLFR